MRTGFVKFWNRRGLGLIAVDNYDLLVFASDPVISNLKQGQQVEFEMAMDRCGRACARKIRAI